MTASISSTDYERFKHFLEQSCGILLGEEKQYLIVSRLTKLLREENIASFSDLFQNIELGQPSHLRDAVIDAMTTNETSWFRDQTPFAVLSQVIFPELDKAGKRQCRVWSSACSSGQEPYTISIILSEHLQLFPTSVLADAQLVATDISSSVLAEAKQGEYDDTALGRGLSIERKQQFFTSIGGRWAAIDEIKQRVNFKEQNLLSDYSLLGKFDIIFCRNVLIYFSVERKTDILKRMAAALNPGGYLFLGASETITGYSDVFEMIRSPQGMFYRLKD